MDKDIITAINLLAKLPGLGPKSARRIILHLLQNQEKSMLPLIDSVSLLQQSIKKCQVCGTLDKISPCNLCSDPDRDYSTLCIVEGVIDVWAFERGNIYKGLYHVLGGTLSAIDGVNPDNLNIAPLRKRLIDSDIKEIIIAINSTVEGQTTAHYITQFIRGVTDITISFLANGIPMGGEMDYLDEGTLSIALNSRIKQP